MKFEIYRSRGMFGGRWRWRLRAPNGRSIAVSGEGYHNKADALSAIDLVRGSAQLPIVETKR